MISILFMAQRMHMHKERERARKMMLMMISRNFTYIRILWAQRKFWNRKKVSIERIVFVSKCKGGKQCACIQMLLYNLKNIGFILFKLNMMLAIFFLNFFSLFLFLFTFVTMVESFVCISIWHAFLVVKYVFVRDTAWCSTTCTTCHLSQLLLLMGQSNLYNWIVDSDTQKMIIDPLWRWRRRQSNKTLLIAWSDGFQGFLWIKLKIGSLNNLIIKSDLSTFILIYFHLKIKWNSWNG